MQNQTRKELYTQWVQESDWDGIFPIFGEILYEI